MKNVLSWGILLVIVGLLVAFRPVDPVPAPPADTIEWLTWEQAMQAMKKQPKKLLIDVYTDWCGWCKRMDQTTFSDPAVAKKVNEHFYAVKFNAEQRETITYDGAVFSYRGETGRRGVHELAYSLLDGRMGYPSLVYLDERMSRITISPGYKDASGIMKELRFVGEGHYRTTKYEDFKQ